MRGDAINANNMDVGLKGTMPHLYNSEIIRTDGFLEPFIIMIPQQHN